MADNELLPYDEQVLHANIALYEAAQAFHSKTRVDPTDDAAIAKWLQDQTGFGAATFRTEDASRIYGMSAMARAVVALWWSSTHGR